MTIFPLAPDQTIAQMWSNGVRGGTVIGHVRCRPTSGELVISETVRLRDSEAQWRSG